MTTTTEQQATENTATAADWPKRKPVRHLNYCGDQRAIIDGPALGPNALGEKLYPVSAEFDPDTDCTRVGLSFIPPSGPVSA